MATREREDGRPEVRAQAKWVRMPARKARVVAEHIRGRPVPEARTVLAFTPRAAARELEKVLASAVANAEANHGLLGDDLEVAAAYVDEGPTMKRWRARARGRVARIRKRTCHITITLAPAAEEARPTPPPTPAGEEKPARAPRRKAAAATAEAEKPDQESVATSETAAEEEPKRTRRTTTRNKEAES